VLSFGASIPQSSANPFLDQCPLKFGHCADDLKHEPTRRGTEVEVISQTDESYSASFQFGE
jgi:hypothetical protein